LIVTSLETVIYFKDCNKSTSREAIGQEKSKEISKIVFVVTLTKHELTGPSPLSSKKK